MDWDSAYAKIVWKPRYTEMDDVFGKFMEYTNTTETKFKIELPRKMFRDEIPNWWIKGGWHEVKEKLSDEQYAEAETTVNRW